jgi:hypothetical protein
VKPDPGGSIHSVISSFTRWNERARGNLLKLWELSTKGFDVTVKNKVGLEIDNFATLNGLKGANFRVVPGTINEGYRTWTSIAPQRAAWVTILHDDDEWLGTPTVPQVKDPATSVFFPLFIHVTEAGMRARPWQSTGFARPSVRIRRFERLPIPSAFGAVRGDVWREWSGWLMRQPVQWHSMDLQLNLACIIMGQQAPLEGFSYAYDPTNWTSAEFAVRRGRELYEAAGIPASYIAYDDLIIRLNSLSLLSSLGTSLPPSELTAWAKLLLGRLTPLSQGRTALIAGLPSTRLREAVIRYRALRSGNSSPQPPVQRMGLRYAQGLARAGTLAEVRESVIPSLAGECPALVAVGAVDFWEASVANLISLVDQGRV